MKELIAPGVWQYDLDSLDEAKKDAHYAADDMSKTFRKSKSVRCVITDGQHYYGPLGENWDTNIYWKSSRNRVVYTAHPTQEK